MWVLVAPLIRWGPFVRVLITELPKAVQGATLRLDKILDSPSPTDASEGDLHCSFLLEPPYGLFGSVHALLTISVWGMQPLKTNYFVVISLIIATLAILSKAAGYI